MNPNQNSNNSAHPILMTNLSKFLLLITLLGSLALAGIFFKKYSNLKKAQTNLSSNLTSLKSELDTLKSQNTSNNTTNNNTELNNPAPVNDTSASSSKTLQSAPSNIVVLSTNPKFSINDVEKRNVKLIAGHIGHPIPTNSYRISSDAVDKFNSDNNVKATGIECEFPAFYLMDLNNFEDSIRTTWPTSKFNYTLRQDDFISQGFFSGNYPIYNIKYDFISNNRKFAYESSLSCSYFDVSSNDRQGLSAEKFTEFKRINDDLYYYFKKNLIINY